VGPEDLEATDGSLEALDLDDVAPVPHAGEQAALGEALGAPDTRPGAAPLLVVLIGHGTADARGARVNLPGPDLTAEALDALLATAGGDPVAVVVATSSSGAFLKPLARPGRVVVTATRAGGERQATRFAAHFAEAFAGEAADADKDGRISLLEAFRYAESEVERSFASASQLQTEHPVLDDDGDGAAGEGDGRLAAGFYLAPAGRVAGDAATIGRSPTARASSRSSSAMRRSTGSPARSAATALRYSNQ